MSLEEDIDALLPQTQCTRCGYPGCRPYAQALARGEVAHNRCPPGGEATIQALSRRLGTEPLPLDPGCGAEGPHRVAVIDEARCIGCAKCLPPCPVDAIIGAPRLLHTVLSAWCTGCELCIAPCPVDCIAMVPASRVSPVPATPAPALNRARYAAHGARLEHREHQRQRLLAERKQVARADAAAQTEVR